MLKSLFLFFAVSFAVRLPVAFTSGIQAQKQDQIQGLAEADRLDSEIKKLREKGRYKDALPLAKRALGIRERLAGPEHPDTARSLYNLGVLLFLMGELADARPHYERALAIFKTVYGWEHHYTASCLHQLGALLESMGEPAKAQTYFKRALAVFEKTLGEHPHTASSLNNLGALLKSMGEPVEAREHFERALAIFKTVYGSEHPDTARSLNNLGTLLESMGVLAEAQAYYKRALVIFEETLGAEHPDTASCLNNLGTVLFSMGKPNDAKRYFERVLKIDKRIFDNHPKTAKSLDNLGSVLQAMGRYKQAKAYLLQALQIREEVLGTDHPDTANSLNNLGGWYKDMGELQEARIYFERAWKIWEKTYGPEHPKTATALSNIAFVIEATGDMDGAIEFKKRALDAQDRSMIATFNAGSEKEKLLFQQALADQTHATVSFHIRSAPNDRLAARLALNTILRRKGRVLDVTSEELRLSRIASTPEEKALFEKFTDLREKRAYILLRSPRGFGPQERLARLDELEKEINLVERELSLRRVIREASPLLTIESVQKKIHTDTALVEFLVYRPFDAKAKKKDRWDRPRYVASVLRRSGDPQWVELGEAEAIESATDAFRNALVGQGTDLFQSARELDSLTMAKVRPLLNGIKRLIISPDGQFNLVPFAGLVDEKEQFLIESYGLSYVTSGRDLLRLATAAPARQAPLVVGGPCFDALPQSSRGEATRSVDLKDLRFGPLEGAREEALEIGRILGLPEERVLTGKAATETAVKQAVGPWILHLATHGFFLEDLPSPFPESSIRQPQLRVPLDEPLLRSGLALTGFNRYQEAEGADDGVFTALEVAQLDLWGTEVVTLSACDTGLGDVHTGEGVLGLRRALVLAGSRTQVMSLWQVADEPTRQLMTSWYRQLQQGVPRAEAMRRIQLAALRGAQLPEIDQPLISSRRSPQSGRDPDCQALETSPTNLRGGGVRVTKPGTEPDARLAGTRHPYFWASFIVSGESGPLPNYPSTVDRGKQKRTEVSDHPSTLWSQRHSAFLLTGSKPSAMVSLPPRNKVTSRRLRSLDAAEIVILQSDLSKGGSILYKN